MSLEEDFELLVTQLNEQDKRIEGLEAADIRRIFPNAITTTDATTTDIFTHTTETNTAYKYKIEIIAIRTDVAGSTNVYERKFKAENIGGTVGILQMRRVGTAEDMNYEREDDTSWAIAVVISGTDIVSRVTGAASQTINWFYRAEILQLT